VPQELPGCKDLRVSKEQWVPQGWKGLREYKVHKGFKVPKVQPEPQVHKGHKALREFPVLQARQGQMVP